MVAGSNDGDGSSISSRRQASADYLYSDGCRVCRQQRTSPWRMRSGRENVRDAPETPSWNPAGCAACLCNPWDEVSPCALNGA